MKITFLLIERTYLASLRTAAAEISAGHSIPLDLAVHVLSDVRSPEGWKAIQTDINASLAVFAIHVTEDDQAKRIASLLEQAPPSLAAFVPMNSVGSLMRLAHMGSMRLSARRGFMSSFGSLIRRPRAERSAESMAGLIAKVSGWLRFLPGRAQDFRTYLLLYTYYLHASPRNLENMLLLVLRRYGKLDVTEAPPEEYPQASIYHPDAPHVFESTAAYLDWFHARPNAPPVSAPKVGIILFRSFVLNENTRHYDAVIRAIEQRALVPVPGLSFALDNRVVQERFFGGVSAILSLTGFGYVGGMGANDAPAAIAALKQQDVPYLDAVALTFQRIEEWLESGVGLNPLQSTMQVAIPELDGATEPFVFGGVPASGEAFLPIDDRVELLADRLSRIVALRSKANSEKRVAITLFSFPPNKGNLGTAAYLDVFASLHRLLGRLRDEGYQVDVPGDPDELRRLVADGNASKYGAVANVAATISTRDYMRGWPHYRDVEGCWGRAPGSLNSNGSELFVLGRHFGNVFVGIQPSFGYEGDPMRLLASKGQTPHHGFCAYYLYLQKIWQADAVIHFGTHGSLEFMPGKQVGLSSSCWPDRLIGPLPHLYVYNVGNPSEGTIAKRRGYGTLVSYLTPPMQEAGLYKDLLRLKDLIEVYRRTGDAALIEDIEGVASGLHLEPGRALVAA